MFPRAEGFDFEETAERFSLSQHQLTDFLVKHKFMTMSQDCMVKVSPVLLQKEYVYFANRDDFHFKNGRFRNRKENLIYLCFTKDGWAFLETMLFYLRPRA